MAQVIFKRKTTAEINELPIVDGQLIWNIETGETYTDIGTERIATGRANVLHGKTIYSDGDSLAEGLGSNGSSYAHLLAEKYNMTLTSKAMSGTTIAVQTGKTSSIYERMIGMTGDYDYIIFDGGINDVFQQIPLGKITENLNDTFDNTTILGALEGICHFLNTNYLSAKKLFVFGNALATEFSFKQTNAVYPKMKEVLEKWGIPYVDIGKICSLANWDLGTSETSVAKDYFDSDMLHPNILGYQTFYLPYIENALLYGGYVNAPSSKDESGEGTFNVSTVIEGEPVKSASYDYQRIGNWVDATVTIEFNAFTPTDVYKSISFGPLPYKCGNPVSIREVCVTTAKKKMIWVVGTGVSTLTLLFFDTTPFTSGEKLSFNIRYKAG